MGWSLLHYLVLGTEASLVEWSTTLEFLCSNITKGACSGVG